MAQSIRRHEGFPAMGPHLVVFVLAWTLTFGIPFTGTLARAADLFVNASSGNDTGACQSTPCKTITYALGQAEYGDVVNVAAGTYDTAIGETFPMEPGDGVSIVGAGDGLPCGVAGTTCVHQDDAATGADTVFFFENHLTQPSSTRLEDMTIQNSKAYATAIFVNATGNDEISPVIQNNTITTAGYGISLYAGSSATVSPTIDNNTLTGNGREGISLGASNSAIVDATLTNNTITDNGSEGVEIFAQSNSDITATISNNTVSDNGYEGVDLFASSSSTITATLSNNTLTGNYREGIGIFASYYSIITATMSNNTISLNDDDGIGIFASSLSTVNATIDNNTVSANGRDGMDIFAATTGTLIATVTNNTVTDNGSNGMDIFAASSSDLAATVSNNTVTGNDWGGVSLFAASSAILTATVDKNAISDNTWFGVELLATLSSSLTAALENNTITGNNQNGIQLSATSPSTTIDIDLGGGGGLGHNTIRDNADYGAGGMSYAIPAFYDFYNEDYTGGGPIKMENNWWGATPPSIDSGSPEHIHNESGTVDADPPNEQALSFTILPSSGPEGGGTPVTITAAAGTFFVDEVGAPTDPEHNIVVTIGGNPATGVSVNASGTQIDATTPAGTGSADVVVTNPGSQTGTLAGGFAFGAGLCVDDDGDGYGNPGDASCPYPHADCDDTDGDINPGATEFHDGFDNDCDGQIDESIDIRPFLNLSAGRTLEYVNMIDEGSGFVPEKMVISIVDQLSGDILAEGKFLSPDYTPSVLTLYQSDVDGYDLLGEYDLIADAMRFAYAPTIGPVDGFMEVDKTRIHDYVVTYEGGAYEGPFRLERTLLSTGVSTSSPAGNFDDCVIIEEKSYDEEGLLTDSTLMLLANSVGPVYRMTNDVEIDVLVNIH